MEKKDLCVVLPARPPIDKVLALKRVYLDYSDQYRIHLAFCDVNFPAPEHFAAWRAMCSEGVEPLLVDVGNRKYHKGYESASAMQKAESTHDGRTYNMLVELINKNNQSGFLKQFRHSVAKMLREVYYVMNSGEHSQEVVVDHALDVVNGFFYFQDKRAWNDLFEKPEHAELAELFRGFGVTEKELQPFTLPLYFRHLFMSGRSQAEIMEKISWWVNKGRAVQQRQEAAQRQAEQSRPRRRFSLPGGKCGGLLSANTYFDHNALVYKWVGSGKLAVGVLKNPKGQVVIQGSIKHPASFSELYAELEKREPGLWYYENRFKADMVMNGSSQYTGVPPTKLTEDELLEIIQKFVSFKSQAA